MSKIWTSAAIFSSAQLQNYKSFLVRSRPGDGLDVKQAVPEGEGEQGVGGDLSGSGASHPVQLPGLLPPVCSVKIFRYKIPLIIFA